MEYQLENDKIAITIDTFGAELKKIVRKRDEKSFLWYGDSKYWGRRAPVLFPFVGKVVNDCYEYEGKKYEIHQHGFARDMEFELVKKLPDEIWFMLESTEETLKKYPFAFSLMIGYRIEGTKIKVIWKVESHNSGKMHFSIGGHPAFMCPIEEGHSQAEYYLKFDKKNTKLISTQFEDGYVVDGTNEYETDEDGMLKLSKNFFDNDAIVLENSQVSEISLVSPEKKTYLTVRFDAPVCGIWSPPKKDAPFICIEPWYGRCDNKNYNDSFENRQWQNAIENNEKFEKSFEIEIEE